MGRLSEHLGAHKERLEIYPENRYIGALNSALYFTVLVYVQVQRRYISLGRSISTVLFLFHFPDPCLVVGIVFEGRISVMDCLLTHKHFVPMPHFISIFLSDV